MENTNMRNVVLGGAVVVILALLGWYLYTNRATVASTSNTASSTAIVTQITGSGSTSTVKANTISVVSRPVAPSLDRAIPATSPGLSAEARAQTIANLQATITNLNKSPLSYQDWLDLGLFRATLTDYTGAELAWQYASMIAPGELTAFENLGSLYQMNLKEYAKAEVNFRHAITINPYYIDSYRHLFEMYSSVYKKGTGAAVDILKEGIAANPTDLSLKVQLARYYRDTGATANARAEYDAAIAVAKSLANTDFLAQMENEKAALAQ